MNVLILSWRLPTHPRAGGAEHLTQRIAEGLVRKGHSVTWGGGGHDAGGSSVTYRGLGSELQGVARAAGLYRSRAPRPDVVVEQVNTLPFFARRFSRVPVLTWFNQLARSVWWHEAPFPLNAFGYAAEPLYLLYYRNADVVTISKSSAEDLRRHKVGKRVSIIPVAVDIVPENELTSKTVTPLRLAFVGRIVSSKRPEDAIEALVVIRRTTPATLDILGPGEPRYFERLRALVQRRGLDSSVMLRGFVDEATKRSVLKHSHLLLVPSAKEGWGLVVTEANRVGTPAVAYDVDGLRDAVIAGETGWLCPPNPQAFAAAVLAAVADPSRYERVRERAMAWSKTLTWDATVSAFEGCLIETLARQRAGATPSDKAARDTA